MSHFMFGDFISEHNDDNEINIVKQLFLDAGLIIYFDKEINFYSEIDTMLAENMSSSLTKFCIGSDIQKLNSEDVLLPYEKYNFDDLFPNGDDSDRRRFNELCDVNLQTVKHAIENLIHVLQLKSIRIFVVDGYDIDFKILHCNLEEMFSDILVQVQRSFSLTSTIYDIGINH